MGRDPQGHFRAVLDDWREAGVDLLPEVEIATALALLDDPSRSPASTMLLAAAGIAADEEEILAGAAWVIAEDSTRHAPPALTEARSFTTRPGTLAERPGAAQRLHPVHVDGSPASVAVLDWLQRHRTLVDSSEAFLRRLALPGKNGEQFVHDELLRQLSWGDRPLSLYHWREREGAEVDLVAESSTGAVFGLETKASSTVRSEDFRWLRRLNDKLGDTCAQGMVFYLGPDVLRFGERQVALPLSALWLTTMCQRHVRRLGRTSGIPEPLGRPCYTHRL